MAAHRRASKICVAVLIAAPQIAACASDPDVKPLVVQRVHDADEAPREQARARAEAPERAPAERDPFVSPFDEGALVSAPAGSTPLTQQELDAFRLVGVVVGTATPMALFEDSQGRGYRARIGDLMGKRGGQVSAIEPGRVVVSERLYDPILGAQLLERAFAIVRPSL